MILLAISHMTEKSTLLSNRKTLKFIVQITIFSVSNLELMCLCSNDLSVDSLVYLVYSTFHIKIDSFEPGMSLVEYNLLNSSFKPLSLFLPFNAEMRS